MIEGEASLERCSLSFFLSLSLYLFLFCSEQLFSRWLHCVKSVRVRNYSVQMRENVDQNNSEYGRILRSVVSTNFTSVFPYSTEM